MNLLIYCHLVQEVYLSSLFVPQTGQLNEYTERKEMKSDVICMGLGRVPAGEQRSRFLAVGLSDNTVRIISLDPNVRGIEFGVGKPNVMCILKMFISLCECFFMHQHQVGLILSVCLGRVSAVVYIYLCMFLRI